MTVPLAFETASRLWRDRITEVPDYSVIRNDRLFIAGFSGCPVLESEYRDIQRFKSLLLDQYRDTLLEEVFPGCTIETAEGPAYCITRRHGIRLPECDPERVRRQLEADLTLVFGIGRRKEKELRRRGYRTIPDLLQHRRFRKPAGECLAVLREGSAADVLSLVSRWHPVSDPRCLSTAGLYGEGKFLFLDLETLGIYQRPVILVGLASVEGDRLVTRQYLVRSMEEELPALLAAKDHLAGEKVLVTYNGRSFDVPYLAERCAMYGEECRIENPHYDLLHPSRRRWRDLFPDCRLSTIEQRLFSIHRDQDVPSMMVPEFYEAFLTTQNPGPLIPVVEHNCQDLVSLVRLFCLFREGE